LSGQKQSVFLSRARRINKLKEKVQKAIDMVRPGLQADGGDVELVDVSPEGVVKVKLTGACHGCPMSQMTLKMGIEKIIKQQVPEIKEVVSI
jgi:Fe-S cluster biogenesis protein NfuA